MRVMKLNKGWAGLEENAKAGGWDSAEQFANEAQLSKEEVESMYWLSDWDDDREMDVSQMPKVEFSSVSSIGEGGVTGIPRNRYYSVAGTGYLSSDGCIYISDDEFENVFC